MSYTPYSAFVNDIAPDLPGATVPIIQHSIRNACIVFATRTRCLHYTMPKLDAIALQQRYMLTSPNVQAEPFFARQVWFGNQQLIRKGKGELAVLYDNWRTRAGSPLFFTQEHDDEILIVPKPFADAPAIILIEVALKPVQDSTHVDELIYRNNQDTIRHGTLARLYASPGKPYTNKDLAAASLKLFNDGIAARQTSLEDAQA